MLIMRACRLCQCDKLHGAPWPTYCSMRKWPRTSLALVQWSRGTSGAARTGAAQLWRGLAAQHRCAVGRDQARMHTMPYLLALVRR